MRTVRRQPGALIGREREKDRLREAMSRRESLLICGPGGAGKSALMREVIAESPARVSIRCLCVECANGRKDLLRQLFRRLHERGDSTLLSEIGSDHADERGFERWLAKQPSRHLGGLAVRAMHKTEYWLFLDHLPGATHAVARLLEDLMRFSATPIYLAARGYTAKQIGQAWRIYWNPRQRIELGALVESAANRLLESCWKANGLASFDLDETRFGILRHSRRLPGAIRAMCALAREPRFQAGSQIKMGLLNTEYLIASRSKRAATFASVSVPESQP